MAVIGETKFIKFTVATLTDMRMTLAQLTLGLMSLWKMLMLFMNT